MARTDSAKKAYRVSARRHLHNVRRKKAMKDGIKEMGKLIASKSQDAVTSLPDLQQAIDKAAKRGVIKKNTAARMKSRISKRIASTTK